MLNKAVKENKFIKEVFTLSYKLCSSTSSHSNRYITLTLFCRITALIFPQNLSPYTNVREKYREALARELLPALSLNKAYLAFLPFGISSEHTKSNQ